MALKGLIRPFATKAMQAPIMGCPISEPGSTSLKETDFLRGKAIDSLIRPYRPGGLYKALKGPIREA